MLLVGPPSPSPPTPTVLGLTLNPRHLGHSNSCARLLAGSGPRQGTKAAATLPWQTGVGAQGGEG